MRQEWIRSHFECFPQIFIFLKFTSLETHENLTTKSNDNNKKNTFIFKKAKQMLLQIIANLCTSSKKKKKRFDHKCIETDIHCNVFPLFQGFTVLKVQG